MEGYGKVVFSSDDLIRKRKKLDPNFVLRSKFTAKRLNLPFEVVAAITPDCAEELAFLADAAKVISVDLAESLWERDRNRMCFGLLKLFGCATNELKTTILEMEAKNLERILAFLIYGKEIFPPR